ncbi:transposase InsO family protein [Neorhizobium sp. 2083]|nr:transposase InsO family protein [Neorhizobium sp. 2083]
MLDKITQSFKSSDRTYGARRVWHDVQEEGLSCGLHRIERLMRVNALSARPRRRGLPKDAGDRAVIMPNVLDHQFVGDNPNQKGVADFTYIWTAEGWLYVAAFIDLFSRRVIGWSMNANMTAQLVTDALIMAIWRRGKPDALLHHSDQGSQYTSEQFQPLMGDYGLSDEPLWKCLEQRSKGELLLITENGENGTQDISHEKRCQSGRVRLHRALLQPETSPTGLSQPQ